EMIPNKLGEFDFLTTLLTNPAFIVALVAKAPKIHYLLLIFAPLLFLPAWAGRARVMLLYGFVFILLASKTAVYSSHFQYSAVLLPVALALAPLGLRRIREARPTDQSLTLAVMGCVLLASVLVSWKHGAILPNSSFRGGFGTVTRSMDESRRDKYDEFIDLISVIEPDASVSATERVGPHLSNRAEIYRVVQGIDTDYVVVDSRDLGRRPVKTQFKRRQDVGELELLERKGPWTLYRAKPPADVE
ncbi:MAG: DUF2079 domain-containing protein, partial [Polyangiales bacterium]